MYDEKGFIEVDGERLPVTVTEDADIIVDGTPEKDADEEQNDK